MKTVLFIDGDLIGFTIAAAAEKRLINVTHTPSGKSKIYKNRTEFKKSMQEKEKVITPDYVITDIQNADEPDKVEKAIKYKLRNLVDKLEADEYHLYNGGKNNFRMLLPLPDQYKGNRVDTIRPVNLGVAMDYIQSKFGSIVPDGHEADDELNIRAYEAKSMGYRPIICTLDKDANQAEGIEVYNWNDDTLTLIDELGTLYIGEQKSKPVKGTGLKFLAFQLLFGDTSDNYCPYSLSKYSFGEKSAFKLLVDLDSPEAVLNKIVETYKNFYPEPITYTSWNGQVIENADWKFMLSMYYKCAYMKRTQHDESDVNLLFAKYGIVL